MKKIKVGLTIKIFLIMMIGFLLIFGYSFTQEVKRYKNNYISLNTQSAIVIGAFWDKYHEENGNVSLEEAYKVLNEATDNGYWDEAKYFIMLDEDFEVQEINAKGYERESYIYIASEYFDLSELTEEQINKISELIPTMNENTVIQISGLTKDREEVTENLYSSSAVTIPTFLQIDDEIIINDYRGRMITRSEFVIQVADYYLYQSENNSIFKNIKAEKEFITNYYLNEYIRKLNNSPTVSVGYNYPRISTQEAILKNGDDTYRIISYSLNVKQESGNTSVDRIDGTVGFVETFYDLDALAYKACFNNNKHTYLMTVVFVAVISIVVSMLITKRIKEIKKAAASISNQEFDVVLNEKGTDELASLSKSINSMSKQLAATISSLQDEIERVKKLENVRIEFIAAFTHEIKTPLAIINGNVELLENVIDEKKKEKYLATTDREIQKINKLVLDMLQLSRLELKNEVLNIEEYLLEDLILDAIDDNHLLIKEKGIQIDLNVSESKTIQVDKDKIIIVINNLLSNAIKYCNNNGKIYIRIEGYEFWIENEGQQIEEKLINKLWDSFVSGSKGGTGLGLAIVKNILDLHECSYGVENTNRGVKFWINFVTIWDKEQANR